MTYTKRGTRIDKSTLKEIYIRKGKNKKQICKKLNVSMHIVQKSIKDHGLELLYDRYVRFLFHIGLRQHEIGKIVNRDQAAISRRLKKIGIDCTTTRIERFHETTYEKYGVHNIQKLEKYRTKTKNTNEGKYGYDTPLRIYNSHATGFFEENKDQILSKTKKSSISFKKYVMPSGREIDVQGYEPFALEILTKTYPENDIVTGERVPVINFFAKGKRRKHYPDIFIPSENKIIEVKSTYTYQITKFLQEKYEKAIELGYKYELWTFDDKQNLKMGKY